MRVIVHVEDLTDMVLAMRSVKMSEAEGHDNCGYAWENGASAFVQRNRTGWTVHIYRDPPP